MHKALIQNGIGVLKLEIGKTFFFCQKTSQLYKITSRPITTEEG